MRLWFIKLAKLALALAGAAIMSLFAKRQMRRHSYLELLGLRFHCRALRAQAAKN